MDEGFVGLLSERASAGDFDGPSVPSSPARRQPGLYFSHFIASHQASSNCAPLGARTAGFPPSIYLEGVETVWPIRGANSSAKYPDGMKTRAGF